MQVLNEQELDTVYGALACLFCTSLSSIIDHFWGGFEGATGGYKAGGILAGAVGGVEGANMGSAVLQSNWTYFYSTLKTLIMPFNIPKSNQSASQQANG